LVVIAFFFSDPFCLGGDGVDDLFCFLSSSVAKGCNNHCATHRSAKL
jgi:hypothetical protein